jgi:hypothetical protein
VFVRFKDEEGDFITDSPKDLLNLYNNAAHLRTHGVEDSLAGEIKSALEIPLPRKVRIYELKYYISAYEKDTMMPKKVLKLAKLNSNIMQLHHQHELAIITS